MSTAPASRLQMQELTKRYGTTTALDRVDLDVPPGSFTAVVGPSGCGKTTLLRLLSGLEPATSGALLADGRDLTRVPAGERGVAMVFQDYALYPHMDVAANISFGLRLQARRRRGAGPDRATIARRTREVAELLELGELLHRRPDQLSGGQRQRVALARAVVRRPPVLLLDEPLAALDAQLRASARAGLQRLHREIGATVVMVTHDQHEAMTMSDHLVVMKDGRVVQAARPQEVYAAPVDRFVATFVGSPPMNLRPGPGDGVLGWRAEDGRLLAPGEEAPAGHLLVEGTAELCEFTGSAQDVVCHDGTTSFTLRQQSGTRWLQAGEPVRCAVAPQRLHHFDRDGRRTG
ncbi:ABC transporter ATP-binding protein [Desertihabitans brevis]|uniref:ABC transporter ATP-binding protein n=1 Tax=Desertihabitans brevis TaxID=2268447 RepID=A0A367YWY8_9ACTN|nr:ABC transporter ATP-binding protein [Desertihabitans brevis]RCK70338.1 ABC transporter ATP-binding protein [Desertihabitans brevis]